MQDNEEAETSSDEEQRENKRIKITGRGEIFRTHPDRPWGQGTLIQG
jgi:hypothetical protein